MARLGFPAGVGTAAEGQGRVSYDLDEVMTTGVVLALVEVGSSRAEAVDLRFPTADLHLGNGHGRIIYGARLPATIDIALSGRRLDEIFDHRLVKGSGLTIASSSEVGGMWTGSLIVQTRALQLDLPFQPSLLSRCQVRTSRVEDANAGVDF